MAFKSPLYLVDSILGRERVLNSMEQVKTGFVKEKEEEESQPKVKISYKESIKTKVNVPVA